MSAFDIHNTDLKILILSSKVAGAEIWKPAQMLTPASYILLAQMVNYFACNFWTVYLYRDDIINFMKVLNSTGIAVQLSIKFFIAIFSKKKLVEMCDMIKTDIYQKYDSRAEPEGEMVYKYAETFHQILKILILMYFSSFVVVGLYPLYFYLVEGELTLLLMIEYPYANWHTTKGFIVTTFVHIVVYFTGICGLVLADALFIMYIAHAMLLIDIFKLHMIQLELLLRDQNGSENKPKIEQKWKQCLQEHQAIAEYFFSFVDLNFHQN